MADGSVAIFGGGPAGLIAAERLAVSGARVTVYEHGRSVGRKLLLAGRGGLNLTHGEPRDRFVARYDAPEWAARLLDEFGPDDLRAWVASLGEGTFVGSSGRVFPESFRAAPLLRAWLGRLDELGVVFETRHRWVGWSDDGRHLVEGPGGRQVVGADAAVLALGGASWPRTGSDGGWVDAFARAGIEVRPLRPSNAGLAVTWSDTFAGRFAGAVLKNVALTAASGTAVRGDVIVTTAGIEGGPVYGAGAAVRAELDRAGSCTLTVDLRPDVSRDRLADRLSTRREKDSTSTWLRRAGGLDPVAVNLLREVAAIDLPDEPIAMADLIKRVPLRVTGTQPIDRAISTAGGVARDELDDSLMLRRRPGTFVAGEMIEWDAPTGGYLLQLSFATGARAARGALQSIAR